MISDHEISTFLRRMCAVVDGVTLDYIAVLVRDSPKSWPEWSQVRVDDKPVDAVIAEVLGHVHDIGESATQENRASYAIRLKLFRAKSPAGSKTFNSNLDAGAERDEGDETPKEAMVATIKELRLFGTSIGAELAARAGDGYRLAVDLVKENASLRSELTEVRIKLAQAEMLLEQDDQSEGKLLETLLPAVIARLGMPMPPQPP